MINMNSIAVTTFAAFTRFYWVTKLAQEMWCIYLNYQYVFYTSLTVQYLLPGATEIWNKEYLIILRIRYQLLK